MAKKTYSSVFVVLVYRNVDDIHAFVESVRKTVKDYKIIIVDSYFDDATSEQILHAAELYGCDYLKVENKGYGYGNNEGIAFALDHYHFDYLIVSNPDIEIHRFSLDALPQGRPLLAGPIIKTARGKYQNPYWLFKNRLAEWFIYRGYTTGNKLMSYAGFGMHKIAREFGLRIFLWSRRRIMRVFALHGSFVVFNYKLIQMLNRPYDDKIFLFSEEADLAYRFRDMRVASYVTTDISVMHKEDGSVKLSDIHENSIRKESVLYYYRKTKRGAK